MGHDEYKLLKRLDPNIESAIRPPTIEERESARASFRLLHGIYRLLSFNRVPKLGPFPPLR